MIKVHQVSSTYVFSINFTYKNGHTPLKESYVQKRVKRTEIIEVLFLSIYVFIFSSEYFCQKGKQKPKACFEAKNVEDFELHVKSSKKS